MLFETIQSVLNVARAMAEVFPGHIGHPGRADYSLNKINVRTGVCVC